MCIHTNVHWSLPLIEKNIPIDDIQCRILKALQNILQIYRQPKKLYVINGNIRRYFMIKHLYVILQCYIFKLNIVQVFKAYGADELTGLVPGAILLHKSPPLILAGDAFCHSNLDGCLISCNKASHMLETL